jgi:hypothetical protein
MDATFHNTAVPLSDAIQGVLNRLDPLDVTPGIFAPVTEYSEEARIFVRLFEECGYITIADIRNIGVETLRDPDWIENHELYAFHSELLAVYGEQLA